MAAADMTALLKRVSSGDKQAESELLPLVYTELHRIAKLRLYAERSNHTLQATELVNEAWVRLTADCRVDWKNRAHFFAIASSRMRHILIDYARRRRAQKRGEHTTIPLDESFAISDEICPFLLDLDVALDKLAHVNTRAARVVELRFFTGLTEDEIAEVEKVSTRTIRRDWDFARAFLYEQLSE
jgi:RNA polymerase sigma factor (TIGR02999 family)